MLLLVFLSFMISQGCFAVADPGSPNVVCGPTDRGVWGAEPPSGGAGGRAPAGGSGGLGPPEKIFENGA